jgi:uncharacterized protein YjbI with pentapeptide repeats
MSDYDPAPTELLDGDEWSGVVATADYIGQRAERFEMGDVRVEGGRWSGVTLDGFRAFDVRFTNCDLAGFVLQEEVSLQNVVFERCRMTGVVFAGVRLRDVRFEECSLEDANLRMLDAERVSFTDCDLQRADLHAARLVDVKTTACDLRGVDLTKAFLQEVDLRRSDLSDVRGADALRGATIDTGQVVALARSLAAALEIKVVDEDDEG